MRKDGVTPEQLEDAKRRFEGMVTQYSSGSRFQRAISNRDFKDELFGLFDRLGAVILSLVATVSVAAVKSFRAADHFKGGETVDGVKVWLGENFKKCLLGKTECDVPAGMLRIHRLEKNSVDSPIIAELGEEAAAETFLAQIWQLLKLQPTGQEGKLLVDGKANIFYVRDDNGTLWAVSCRWDSGYRDWRLEAVPVTDPYGWRSGIRVLSR